MRTETITRELYSFDELNADAQQHALEALRDLNVDRDWHGPCYYLIRSAGRCLGIECTVEGFGLYRSQFIDLRGAYTYNKRWRAELVREFDGDLLAALVKAGEALQAAQRRAFYTASAKLHRPYFRRDGASYTVDHERGADVTDELVDALRSFTHWAWRLLRNEFEYLTSAEAIKKTIEANEYEFDVKGNLA